jgi:hypothetical protein
MQTAIAIVISLKVKAKARAKRAIAGVEKMSQSK